MQLILKLAVGMVALSLLIAGTVVMTVMLTSNLASGQCEPAQGILAPADTGGSPQADNLSQEQTEIAKLIIDIGVQRGRSYHDIKTALMTAQQESGMRNLSYGDRDSLGILQQRPSQGWGTPAQILDPVYSANKFYQVLEKIQDRESKTPKELALRVQRPSVAAYNSSRNNFDSHESMAIQLLSSSGVSSDTSSGPALSSPMTYGDCPDPDQAGAGGHQVSNPGSNGWVKPLDNPRVGSPYGMRRHPILGVMRMHDGTDIPAGMGASLYAMNHGQVVDRGYGNVLGNHIKVDHGNGVTVHYLHLSRFADVRIGDRVVPGQTIGYVGSTGRSTGPHLHLTLRVNDELRDPVPYFCNLGVQFTGPRGCR